ncbi:MAG: hypothetical protein K6F31_10175 [Acetatifactor sp.]|nr:hypothetical protein [Acetatifactor sp.]
MKSCLIQRKIHLVLGFMLLLLLAGCHFSKEEVAVPEQMPTSEIYVSPEEYKKVTLDLNVTPTYHPDPFLFDLTAKGFYFGETRRTETEEATTYQYSFYKVDLQEGNDTTLVLSGNERVLSFQAETVGDEDLLSILTVQDDAFFFREYDINGKQLEEIIIQDREFREAFPFCHVRNKDGSFYAIGKNKVFHFGKNGVESITPKGVKGEFLECAVTKEGTLYIVSQGNKKCTLSRMDSETKKWEEAMILPSDCGKLIPYGDTEMLLLLENGICQYGPAQNEVRMVLDFSEYIGIAVGRLRALNMRDNKLEVISWKGNYQIHPVQLFSFSKMSDLEKEERKRTIGAADRDAFGRKKVVVLDATDHIGTGIPEVIEEFNHDNGEYYIEYITDFSDMNAMLTGDNSVDLVILNDVEGVRKYYDKGYLEDLLPYVRDSLFLSDGNFQEYVWEAFLVENRLLAIPRRCSFSVVLARGKGIQEKKGWDLEEFLGWIEDEEVNGNTLIDNSGILSMCMIGNMDLFLDDKIGRAMFDQKEFKEILRRIKTIDIQKKNAEGESYLFMADFNSLSELAFFEANTGGDVSNLGIPNEKKIVLTKVGPTENMCILSKSKNKDGAFSVMEYILYYPGEGIIGEENPRGGLGEAWSLKDLFEADAIASQGENTIFMPSAGGDTVAKTIAITDREVEYLKEWMSHAKIETSRDYAIRLIVLEEADGYFTGQKNLEDTCKVIQQRVQLLLDENR